MPDSPMDRVRRERATDAERLQAAEDEQFAPLRGFRDAANALAVDFSGRAPDKLFVPVARERVAMRTKGLVNTRWVVTGDRPTAVVHLVPVAVRFDSTLDSRSTIKVPPVWSLDRSGQWWLITQYIPEGRGNPSLRPLQFVADPAPVDDIRHFNDLATAVTVTATRGTRQNVNETHLVSNGQWDEVELLLGVRLLEILEGRVILNVHLPG